MTGSALRVITPGLLTTVQDGGRRGQLRWGVPPSGAADGEGLRLANLLAGNDRGAAALEITHSGPTLEVLAARLRLAVAGADVEVEIVHNGRSTTLGGWQSITLERGDRIRVGRPRDSLRCYLAVHGGLDVPTVMGSRSTYLRGGFGGLDGRAVRMGDELAVGDAPPPAPGDAALADAAALRLEGPVRIVLGPQVEGITAAALDTLLWAEYAVSHRSDRVGLRLHGPALQHDGAAEIVSDACVTGSVQVPGDKSPIVLLCDRGTTGGYPKVATVATVDLPRLGRLRPGDRLRFAAVEVELARELRREREALLTDVENTMRHAHSVHLG